MRGLDLIEAVARLNRSSLEINPSPS